MSELNRRQFILGAAAGVLLPHGVEAAEVQREQVERRQQYYESVQARLQHPIEAADGKTVTELTNELKQELGPWFAVFGSLNNLRECKSLLDALAHFGPRQAVWQAQHGPAAQFEILYEQLWSPEREQRLVAAEHTPVLHHVPAAVEPVFAPGQCFPRGWLSSVSDVQWYERGLRSPFVRRRAVDGMALPNPTAFVSERKDRTIRLGMRSSMLPERKAGVIFHEVAHANDWDTGAYPVDFKIQLYWQTLQQCRIAYEQAEHFVTPRKFSALSPFERWRAVMEYWADEATNYYAGQTSSPSMRQVIEQTVARTDQAFVPGTAYGRALSQLG